MNRLIRGLLLLALCTLPSWASAAPGCEDFLSKISDKPAFVEFLQCTQATDRQGRPFVAQYRITGADALKAERYMTQRFGLPPLKFYCCVWDSMPYFYRDKKTDLGYSFVMASEETPINQRESWPDIKFFYINVSLDTEEI